MFLNQQGIFTKGVVIKIKKKRLGLGCTGGIEGDKMSLWLTLSSLSSI